MDGVSAPSYAPPLPPNSPPFALQSHLLICKHSAEGWAPVDRHLRLVGQASLEELEEDPLSPPASRAGQDIRLGIPYFNTPHKKN